MAKKSNKLTFDNLFEDDSAAISPEGRTQIQKLLDQVLNDEKGTPDLMADDEEPLAEAEDDDAPPVEDGAPADTDKPEEADETPSDETGEQQDEDPMEGISKSLINKLAKADPNVEESGAKVYKELEDLLSKTEDHPAAVEFIHEVLEHLGASKELASSLQDDMAGEEAEDQVAEGLIQKVDAYLTMVSEQFLDQNKINLEPALKISLAEQFFGNVKGLMESFSVKVPEKDVLIELGNKLAAQETKLNEEVQRSAKLAAANAKLRKDSLIAESARSLSDTERESFLKLAEGVTFRDAASFASNLKVLKEEAFKTSPNVKVQTPVVNAVDDSKDFDRILGNALAGRALQVASR